MHALKLIALCVAACGPLALAFSAPAAAPAGERALREECSANSQAGMRDCLVKKAQISQEALKQVEEKVAGTLSKWDESEKYIKPAQARLAASNSAFSKYRDSQCEFLASLSGGGAGNAREMRRQACISELNDRRAEQLRDAASDLPLK